MKKLILLFGLLAAHCFAQASTPVTVGQGVKFDATANGTTPFNYTWYKDNAPIQGATQSSYSIPSVQLSDAGNYKVTISNSAGLTQSPPASIVISLQVVAPTNATVTVTVTPAKTP